MQQENLIFEKRKKTAAAFTLNPDGVLGELNSGSAYKEFVGKITDPENTMVVPINIFGDGTVIDGAFQKPLEPFSFTLGRFWQHTRAQPSAWRNLGYIKNNPYVLFDPEEIREGNEFRNANAIHKNKSAFVPDTCRDYHSQIEIVMKCLKDAQAILNGMQIWPPWIKGSYRVYKIVFPIAFLWEIRQCMINCAAFRITRVPILFVACAMFPGKNLMTLNSNIDCVMVG